MTERSGLLIGDRRGEERAEFIGEGKLGGREGWLWRVTTTSSTTMLTQDRIPLAFPRWKLMPTLEEKSEIKRGSEQESRPRKLKSRGGGGRRRSSSPLDFHSYNVPRA